MSLSPFSWGGSMYPVNLMNADFMTFLTNAAIVITVGIFLIKYVNMWIVIGDLYRTLLITVLYMVSMKMNLWVLLIGIVMIAGFVWWLTTKITDNYLKSKLR
jgi:hypothetical protein